MLAVKVRSPRSQGLPRDRLADLLAGAWNHQLTLVTAPAGSGKTTLLAHFAAESPHPVAWYRAEGGDTMAADLLSHVAAAWQALGPPFAGLSAASPESLAAGLAEAVAGRAALVIDDLHTVRGTEAEVTLQRLLECLPPEVVVVAGTRVQPRFNLSRLRVSGQLLEVGADELRFRSWEVEALFRQVYREPLRPEDLAELARRTGGWAAGLQLFHLATRGKPVEERRRAVGALANRHGLVHEYLVRNVLDELEPQLRDFVMRAAALGRMNGELCDNLLDTTGSQQQLEELERRQVFTVAVEPTGWFRFHEVLRSHAEAAFLLEVGEDRARAHRLQAAGLLEKAGAWSEALVAYCRAGDWEAAGRLVGWQAEELVAGPWMDLLPEDLRADPWVLLAAARRHRAAGRVDDAVETYLLAERRFGTSSPASVCRAERLALGDWLPGAQYPSVNWSGLVRAALTRDPTVAADQALAAGRATGSLAAGIALLLAGRIYEACSALDEAVARPDASPAVLLAADLARAIAGVFSGESPETAQVESLVEACDDAGYPWLAQAAGGLVAPAQTEALSDTEIAASPSDPWGSALRHLLVGWSRVGLGEPAERVLLGLMEECHDVAPVGEAWALALYALDRARTATAGSGELGRRAEQMARSLGTPGPQAIAYLALSYVGGASAEQNRDLARSIARELGLALPGLPLTAPSAPVAESPRGTLGVACFGRFTVTAGDQPVDLGGLKPRVRSLLRFLALQAGRPVHREIIIDALWPEVDGDTGTRSLQVAISSLRQAIDQPAGASGGSIIARDGDAYYLSDVSVDVSDVAAALGQSRALLNAGDTAGAERALQAAVDLYAGELLPEEGPAEWVVGPREQYRLQVAEAALEAARLAAQRGDAAAAASRCERALQIDPMADAAWQLLIASHEQAGAPASAARCRARYSEVLAQLGVEAPAGR